MAFAETMAGVNGFLYFFALVAVVGILVVLSMMYNNKMCTLDAPGTYCSDMNSERNQTIGRAALLRRMRGDDGMFAEGMKHKKFGHKFKKMAQKHHVPTHLNMSEIDRKKRDMMANANRMIKNQQQDGEEMLAKMKQMAHQKLQNVKTSKQLQDVKDHMEKAVAHQKKMMENCDMPDSPCMQKNMLCVKNSDCCGDLHCKTEEMCGGLPVLDLDTGKYVPSCVEVGVCKHK